MKFAKMLLVLAVLLVAVCGCKTRNSTTNPTSQAQNSASSTASQPMVSSGAQSERAESEIEENYGNEFEDMNSEEPEFENEDEESAAAMSTDFKEIGALNADLVEWGSGGPADAAKRPNGCTAYQQKYGKYDAYFITPASQKVYLTFDEGYENGYTTQILDTLKQKNVRAAFFITYPYAQQNPELVKRMINEGHTIGNHSTRHKSFPSMSLEEAAEDVKKLHDYVKANFGYEMTLFRFPEGKFSEQTLALLQSMGYKSLFWSFAYKDYDVNDQPLTIEALAKIVDKCHPGALYLLHAVSKTNTQILGEVIDQIRAQGYTISVWDIY